MKEWIYTVTFMGAIFDFDGTLAESIGVWSKADDIFLARRGIEMPQNFYETVSGLSLLKASEYIVRELNLAESPQEVEREFLDIVAYEYAHEIGLVRGAAEFLRRLKAAGIKLAIATASQEALYRPCLERHGVMELFDCVVTASQVNKAKGHPDIYLLAAKRLGLPSKKCVVFEDIYQGVLGAKRAGMSCICLKEEHSRADWVRLADSADMMIEDFSQLM